MMLLDLSSAFDTVDHNTLLSILSSRFLISGQALAWFRSYLTDRSQVFTTDSTHAPSISMLVFPKVYGLGPTQFIAYTEYTPPISFPCTISNISCSLMTLNLMAIVHFLKFLTSSSATRNISRILLDPIRLSSPSAQSF